MQGTTGMTRRVWVVARWTLATRTPGRFRGQWPARGLLAVISEMFAKSTRAGTASRQGDDRTTLYGDTERGENNSMFDATERAKTEGTQTDAATERATEKGSLYDASERRSHVGTGEDITERGSGCDVTERGSVADPMEGSAIL